MFEVKVIADSICNGNRLTTMQLTHPRIVHAEFMTHAMFARNASSSRAIPFEKMVQRIKDDPFIPEVFGVNQKGMQAKTNLEGELHDQAVSVWLDARDTAIRHAKVLANPHVLNVHKQITNRIIEPWMWITVCATGDAGAWSNYFALRCHDDAEDNLRKQAYMAQLAYYQSTPVVKLSGQWHMPYVGPGDWEKFSGFDYDLIKISTGRCARTSYLTQEGIRDYLEDIRLHDSLRDHRPMHASPFEHPCQAMGDNGRYGKYIGWKSYRHMLPNEYTTDFVPNHPLLLKKVVPLPGPGDW